MYEYKKTPQAHVVENPVMPDGRDDSSQIILRVVVRQTLLWPAQLGASLTYYMHYFTETEASIKWLFCPTFLEKSSEPSLVNVYRFVPPSCGKFVSLRPTLANLSQL